MAQTAQTWTACRTSRVGGHIKHCLAPVTLFYSPRQVIGAIYETTPLLIRIQQPTNVVKDTEKAKNDTIVAGEHVVNRIVI